jgi:hypothetical protein
LAFNPPELQSSGGFFHFLMTVILCSAGCDGTKFIHRGRKPDRLRPDARGAGDTAGV